MSDLKLTQHVRAVNAGATALNRVFADGENAQLFQLLEIIEDEARKAKYRLNDLKFRRGDPDATLPPVPAASSR